MCIADCWHRCRILRLRSFYLLGYIPRKYTINEHLKVEYVTGRWRAKLLGRDGEGMDPELAMPSSKAERWNANIFATLDFTDAYHQKL